MTERVLLDTGPLVATLSPKDPYHQKCREVLRGMPRGRPLLTCWPVVTEAAWLVRNQRGGIPRLMRAIDGKRVRILELDADATSWIADFTAKYESLPVQLADAALVYLAHKERISTVFTLDRRHFSVYRLPGGNPLRLLPEG